MDEVLDSGPQCARCVGRAATAAAAEKKKWSDLAMHLQPPLKL
jgi:hypothetical protein